MSWPFFGYWRLLKPSDCDWNFLQQVTASEVFDLLRGCLALCFHCRDLLLHTQTNKHKHVRVHTPVKKTQIHEWQCLLLWSTTMKRTLVKAHTTDVMGTVHIKMTLDNLMFEIYVIEYVEFSILCFVVENSLRNENILKGQVHIF